MRSLELRQKRARLVTEMRAILKKAEDEENRGLTSEEAERWDKLDADAEALNTEITRAERQEQLDRDLKDARDATRAVVDPSRNPGPSNDEAENDELASRAFEIFLRAGEPGVRALPEAQRNLLRRPEQRVLADCYNALPTEVRAQTVSTTGGGYLIPRAFQRELDQAMLAFGGMRQAARIVTTADGATLDWPTVNDTGQTGELLGINIQVNTQDITYGTVPFEAYKYSSKAVLVPVELMQDAFFDMNGHVRGILAERLGRITNTHLTTGTGTAQPKGAVTAAVDSAVNLDLSELAAGNVSVSDALIDCVHTIDPAYRPGSRWMFEDGTLKALKKIKDADNRPIFDPGGSTPGGDPATIAGYPYTINQDVPTATGTNKAIVFGQWNKYIVRVVRPMVMLRLTERYADYHQVGYFAFERLDGDLVDAGTNPLKYMDCVA